jgi:general secretion pathway protein E
MRLDEVLIRRGFDAARVHAALDGCDAADLACAREALLRAGVLGESEWLAALGELYGLPVARRITAEMLDASLIADLPVEWARGHKVLPIRYEGSLGVAARDPSAMRDMDYLALILGQELSLVLAPEREIERAIERVYFEGSGSAQDALERLDENREAPADDRNTEDLLRVTDNAPVTQYVNSLLLDALRVGASDVHVEPFETSLKVRFRVDGLLYEQAAPPKQVQPALAARLKVMAHLDIAEKRLPQDGTARVRVGEREVDIRVSTIPVAEGERVVLRLLNRESTLLPLSELGMPPAVLEPFRAVIQQPFGMVLVTGPTGSGKTTTLYAALRELDTKHRNILTVEDPIEYQLPDIGQMQVKPKIGLTFSVGLRHILRQDPDVILVGETRDLETAEIAVRAALTGHLVFTTVHTNDAASAVIRLVDIGVPAYLLSSALRAALAQRLVRRLCAKCKRPGVCSDDVCCALGEPGRKLRGQTVMQPVGCPACLGGYRGRTGLFEFLSFGNDMAELIRRGGRPQELRAAAVAQGMQTLLHDGVDKICAGETSVAEVLRAVGRG